MAKFSQEERDAVMLSAGQLAAIARDMNLEALEEILRTDPGPEFYTSLRAATAVFVRDVQRIFRELSHQRLKFGAPRRPWRRRPAQLRTVQ